MRVALGWAKMAVVAAQNPREKMDREFQVLAKRVHVDALAKAERALSAKVVVYLQLEYKKAKTESQKCHAETMTKTKSR